MLWKRFSITVMCTWFVVTELKQVKTPLWSFNRGHSCFKLLVQWVGWCQLRKLSVKCSWQQAACKTLFLPAHVVRFADAQLSQAVGLVLVFVGAGRHNGLPAALCAGRVSAGTEQQLVGVVRGNTVKELPKRLVALWSVTWPRAGWRLDAARDVFRPKLLTRLIYVTRLGSIQAAVHRRYFRL